MKRSREHYKRGIHNKTFVNKSRNYPDKPGWFYFWIDILFMKKYFLLPILIALTGVLFAQQATQAKKIVADKIAAVVGDRIFT